MSVLAGSSLKNRLRFPLAHPVSLCPVEIDADATASIIERDADASKKMQRLLAGGARSSCIPPAHLTLRLPSSRPSGTRDPDRDGTEKLYSRRAVR